MHFDRLYNITKPYHLLLEEVKSLPVGFYWALAVSEVLKFSPHDKQIDWHNPLLVEVYTAPEKPDSDHKEILSFCTHPNKLKVNTNVRLPYYLYGGYWIFLEDRAITLK